MARHTMKKPPGGGSVVLLAPSLQRHLALRMDGVALKVCLRNECADYHITTQPWQVFRYSLLMSMMRPSRMVLLSPLRDIARLRAAWSGQYGQPFMRATRGLLVPHT